MTVAFVLSGGASLAAVQVGMLQALGERGIHPDLLVGTSAGAINAAYVAGRGTSSESLDELGRLWMELKRRTVFRVTARHTAMAFLGVHNAVCSAGPLAGLLAGQLPYGCLQDARTPVHVVSTDVLTGEEVRLSSGDAVTALLASCAIPGVFPTVDWHGRALCDGALADNSAISQAVALGADTVYVLPGGTACALERPPGNPVAASLHAVTLLLQQRMVLETRLYAGAVDLHVLPPLCPLTVSPANFAHARELITRARTASGQWLDSGNDFLPGPERFLSLHGHHGPTSPVDTRRAVDVHAATEDCA